MDQLSEQQYQDYKTEILRLIAGESVFVSLYAMDKIPAGLYEDSGWQEALAALYKKLSYRQQDRLLQKLQKAQLSGESMHLLAGQMDSMNEKQLGTLLQLLVDHKDLLQEETIPLLVALLSHDNPAYAEKGYQALQAMNLKNRHAQKAIREFEKNR